MTFSPSVPWFLSIILYSKGFDGSYAHASMEETCHPLEKILQTSVGLRTSESST